MTSRHSPTGSLWEVIPPTFSPSSCEGRFLLVNDSIKADGRFLLHAFVTDLLNNSKSARVLWVGCGPFTKPLIVSGLKKLGCEALASIGGLDELSLDDASLHIHCVPLELCSLDDETDLEQYARSLYKRIKHWVLGKKERTTCLVVLDDASTLATLLGERVVYALVASLKALSTTNNNDSSLGMLVRCCVDSEHELVEIGSMHAVSQGGWIGAGGTPPQRLPTCVLESQLQELSDGIIDTLPLVSGYSREANGRLVFTKTVWGNNKESADTQTVVNYTCGESSITAVKIRTMP